MYPCGTATILEQSLNMNSNRVLATINNLPNVPNLLRRHVHCKTLQNIWGFSIPAGALSSIFLDKRRSVELHLVDLCGRGRLGPLPFPLPLLLSWHCCCYCCFTRAGTSSNAGLSHQTEMRQSFSLS